MISGLTPLREMRRLTSRSNFDCVQWQGWMTFTSSTDSFSLSVTKFQISLCFFFWSLWSSRYMPSGQNSELGYCLLYLSRSSRLALAKWKSSSLPELRLKRQKLAVSMKCLRNWSRMMFSEQKFRSRYTELPQFIPAYDPSKFEDPIIELLSDTISFSWCRLHTSFVKYLCS